MDIKLDPWLETQTDPPAIDIASFEDNFKPDIEHLPDSKEYLAILESKLERIRNDPNVLKQLSDKREACMQQLLNSCNFADEEQLSFETPINQSNLIRTIAPQRAALNQGEVVELVRYDQLLNDSGDETNEKQLT